MNDEQTPERPKAGRRPVLRRGAYLLPSLFTIGNILLGFYAIVCGFRGNFGQAAVMIFVAGILDGLDGRIARMTGTDSDFGREYDSLADVLTFGMAPAVLSYTALAGQTYGRFAWLVPLFFLVCVATRLARFNVQTTSIDSRSFVGLPAPAAAGSIAALMLFFHDRGLTGAMGIPLLTSLMLLGILMVSTFRYPSFKKFDLRRRWSYRMVLPITAALLIVGYDPPAFFLIVALMYDAWPPIAYLLERVGLRRKSKRAEAAAREST